MNEGHYCSSCLGRNHECPPVTTPRPSTLKVKCPQCRVYNDVDIDNELFSNSECVVCFEHNPLVLFPTCKHVVVCKTCVQTMHAA